MHSADKMSVTPTSCRDAGAYVSLKHAVSGSDTRGKGQCCLASVLLWMTGEIALHVPSQAERPGFPACQGWALDRRRGILEPKTCTRRIWLGRPRGWLRRRRPLGKLTRWEEDIEDLCEDVFRSFPAPLWPARHFCIKRKVGG